MHRIQEVDPTTMNRKKRREFVNKIDEEIRLVNRTKTRNLVKLSALSLTLEEVEKGMKGESAIEEVNKICKALLEVNNSLVSLAQQKAHMLAVRDMNSHPAPIPDGQVLPHGTDTERN
jgi:hypothetical protein